MGTLEQGLEEVSTEILRMLSLVRESMGYAAQALLQADASAATLAERTDIQVDAMQERLEGVILGLLAEHSPAGRDRRFLGAAYRSLVDIERAGDYAVHVARSGAELAERPPLKKYLDMQRMLEVADSMIDGALAALIECDVTAADGARELDEEIDRLYEQVQRELLTYMAEDAQTIITATKLLAVGRYLERLGDHIENVCEHIVFWLTAERR